MKKTSITCAIIAAIVGICLMVGCFFLFKYMPLRIDGDKWAMWAMFEVIIAVFTLFFFGSFVYDYKKD